MLIPFATRPAQPMYCRFTPAVADPCFSWPVSSSAPTVIRLRRDRRAASSRPATAYLLTRLIAARSSHEARLSRRCALAGDRSPACSATDQPFRDGRSLTSAFRYFPACSHVCVRAKHDRSSPIRADRSRTARPAPILAAAAALFSFVLTNNMIPGGCAHVTAISPAPLRPRSSGPDWMLPYCAAPRPALPAPGSGLGRPRPARPRRPVQGGTADLTGSFEFAGRSGSRLPGARFPVAAAGSRSLRGRHSPPSMAAPSAQQGPAPRSGRCDQDPGRRSASRRAGLSRTRG